MPIRDRIKNLTITGISSAAAGYGLQLINNTVLHTPGYKTLSLCSYIVGLSCIAYDILSRPDKLEIFTQELFTNENIHIKRKATKDYGYDIFFNIPLGITTDLFEKKKLEYEQHLNAAIKFDFTGKYIKMIVNTNDDVDIYNLLDVWDDVKPKENELFIGYTKDKKKIYYNFEKMPHLLVAGATGQGKSISLLNLIVQLHKKKCIINLIDMKGSEFSFFRKSRLVQTYSKTKDDFVKVLDILARESKKRFDLFEKNNCRDIYSYNSLGIGKLHHIFTIIDEFGVFEKEKDIHLEIQKRCSLDRAAGMHIIIATQSPRHQVLTGLIKANIPARLAFRCWSDLDSQIILELPGAEKLKGNGHGIFKTDKIPAPEIQTPYISENEIKSFIKPYEHVQKKSVIKNNQTNIHSNINSNINSYSNINSNINLKGVIRLEN